MTNPKEVLSSIRSDRKIRVLEMSPGPELDVMIAENIFGYVINDDWFGWCYDDDADYHFSTNISAAMEAAEKVGTYQLTKMGVGNPLLQYRAIVGSNGNVAYAKTAAEALSKAALVAVMCD